MEIPEDFRDLLREFASADVRYLLIGGYAVSFHDRPRYTKDIDLLLDASDANCHRTATALLAFGASDSIRQQLLEARPDEIVWLGAPPLRIDLIKAAPGVDFESAYARRVVTRWGDVAVHVMAAEDLLRAKEAAGRPQDLLDARRLRKLLNQAQ